MLGVQGWRAGIGRRITTVVPATGAGSIPCRQQVCFGVALRISPFGKKPAEAAQQASGSHIRLVYDRGWVASQ